MNQINIFKTGNLVVEEIFGGRKKSAGHFSSIDLIANHCS